MFLSHHRLMDNRGFRRIHHVAGAVPPQILFCSLFCKRDTIVLFKLNFTFLFISIAIIIVIIIILQNKLTSLGVPFFIIFTTAKIKNSFGFHCVASFVSLIIIIICRRLHKRRHTYLLRRLCRMYFRIVFMCDSGFVCLCNFRKIFTSCQENKMFFH